MINPHVRLNWLDALRLKKLFIYVCIQSLLKSIVYGLLFWLPSYIQDKNNPDLKSDSGIISSMNSYGSFIGGVAVGWVSDRYHKKVTAQFSFLLLGTGDFILCSFLGNSAWTYYSVIFFIGIFIGEYTIIYQEYWP